MTLIQDRLLSIATDPLLSFKQKSRQFALSADEQLPYLSLSDGLSTALESRVVCDMFEMSILDHPALEGDAKALAEEISTKLGQLYGMLGEKS